MQAELYVGLLVFVGYILVDTQVIPMSGYTMSGALRQARSVDFTVSLPNTECEVAVVLP